MKGAASPHSWGRWRASAQPFARRSRQRASGRSWSAASWPSSSRRSSEPGRRRRRRRRRGPAPASAEVLVHVIAGDPSSRGHGARARGDDARASRSVIVELWPQAGLDPPFVLSPFVVECRAGRAFRSARSPIGSPRQRRTPLRSPLAVPTIARRRARGRRQASRDPLGADRASQRAASARRGRCISLEQVRMVARLAARVVADRAGATSCRCSRQGRWPSLASGFALRQVARVARAVILPDADCTRGRSPPAAPGPSPRPTTYSSRASRRCRSDASRGSVRTRS